MKMRNLVGQDGARENNVSSVRNNSQHSSDYLGAQAKKPNWRNTLHPIGTWASKAWGRV